MWLIKKIGSLYFAAALSVLLMVLLIISTTLESVHGTSFVQKMFYQTRWFDILLALLWLNIFCSTISRFPFKIYHIGFLITHIGILGLLLGALLTRLYGIEGQMALFEGEASHQIKVGGYQVNVTFPDKKTQTFNLNPANQPFDIARYKETNLNIVVSRIIEHAVEQPVVKDGGENHSKKFALRVNLSSQAMKANNSVWVVEGNEMDPHGGATLVGPLKVSIREKSEPTAEKKTPELIIYSKDGKELSRIDLTVPSKGALSIKGTDLKIAQIAYYSNAKVGEKNQLVNSEQGGLNPAVEFDISDSKGNKVHFVKFALFPDFESMHQKSSAHSFDVVTKLEAPQGDAENYDGPSLTFLFTPDDKWSYKVMMQNKVMKEGEARLNTSTELGFMDMSFRVDEIIKHAVVSSEVAASSNPKEGVFAVEISSQDDAGRQSRWMTEGQKVGLHAPKGDIAFELVSAQKILPFTLTLKDFRKKDYPGTQNPSSFESDVTLDDTKENLRLEKTISMNKPLDYKGYRVFQSSFMQGTNAGEASVFTVAKNPGITLIYLSSCVLFTGAMLQFYVKQFSRRPAINGQKGNHGT